MTTRPSLTADLETADADQIGGDKKEIKRLENFLNLNTQAFGN